MDDYLTKPIDADELDQALGRWGVAKSPPNGRAEDPVAQPGHDSLLDDEVMARMRQDFAPEQREQLLAMFEEQLAARLPELNAAGARRDSEELRRLLHLLKGGSVTIGARAFSEACRELEGQAGDGQAPAEISRLRELAQETIAALRAELLRAEPSIALY